MASSSAAMAIPAAAAALLLAAPWRTFAVGDAPGPEAEIILRKSFPPRSPPVPGEEQPPRPAAGDAPAGSPAAPAAAAGEAGGEALSRGVAAIGERYVGAGVLHLPQVPAPGAILDLSRTPVVELANGRRLILDYRSVLDLDTAAAVAARWPAYRVVPLPAGGLRERIGAILAGSGYAAVDTGAEVSFGHGASVVRIRPDFVVLKGRDDLLHGRTLALSVVDSPRGAVPPELRDLAAERGVAVSDLLNDGRGAVPLVTPWRDPAGRVTTVIAGDAGLVAAEIARVLGHEVRRLRSAGGYGSGWAIGPDGGELVLAPPADESADSPSTSAGALEVPRDGEGFAAVLGRLFERLELGAIGPVVEFTRPDPTTGASPFLVSVPGWLVEHGGRRLLVTAAAPPEPLRLFLVREGIDLFEYRLGARPSR